MWLVTNRASGSNKDSAVAQLRQSAEKSGLTIEREFSFPEDPLPGPEELDQADIELIAVFAGDGTVNALVTSLYGWSGAVLILPGGTMNLMYHRLHGKSEAAEVLDAVAAGQARRTRPAILRCDQGDALAGLMAGPGIVWNHVREAARRSDIPAMASEAANALEQTLNAPMIACRKPPIGRPEGYPLIMLTPGDTGFAVDAYHSETPDEFLAQGLALLRRNFRDGPHDQLGDVGDLLVESMSDEAIGLLIDGEPADAGSSVRFIMAPCEVDLLATADNV